MKFTRDISLLMRPAFISSTYNQPQFHLLVFFLSVFIPFHHSLVMRALSRVQDRLRPSQSPANDVDGRLPGSAVNDSQHPPSIAGLPCAKCPGTAGRCVRHLARRLHGGSRDVDGTGQQPSGTSGDDATEQCWCSDLVDCMCGGMRRLVTTLTDTRTNESKCRTPGCKRWKSGCTRIYLIVVNLASFVRTN